MIVPACARRRWCIFLPFALRYFQTAVGGDTSINLKTYRCHPSGQDLPAFGRKPQPQVVNFRLPEQCVAKSNTRDRVLGKHFERGDSTSNPPGADRVVPAE